jgi:hypothetical protein
MARYALVLTEENKIILIDDDIKAMSGHTLMEVPDGIEPWRFSLNDDGELVIAYEGQDSAMALASLKSKQDDEAAAIEADTVAARGDG